MNSYKKLVKVAFGISGLGLLILIYNFFKTYSLVGDCPSGNKGCRAYSNWQLTNKIGLVVVAVGAITFLVLYYRQNKNR